MNTAETFGIAGAVIAVLVAMIQALISYVYTSNKSAIDKSLGGLTEQNRVQALDIATLKQQVLDGSRRDDHVFQAVEKCSDRIDRLANEVAILVRRSSGSGGSGPGEYKATR